MRRCNANKSIFCYKIRISNYLFVKTVSKEKKKKKKNYFLLKAKVIFLLVELMRYSINKDQDNLVIYLKFNRKFLRMVKINVPLIKLKL